MAIIFEDRAIQTALTDLVRTPAFRKLKAQINDEANATDGKPLGLAEAMASYLTDSLTEDLIPPETLKPPA